MKRILLLLIFSGWTGAASADDNLTVRWSRDVVRWGEPVTLEVTSQNQLRRNVQGGITISFSSNVIVTSQDPEARIFYENSSIFGVGHRRTIRSREIMVENWYGNWPAYSRRSLRLTFFPLKTGVMTVKIRTAMIRSLARRDVVNYPGYSACRDQQGYPAECHKILVEESQSFLDNLRRIINTEAARDPVFLRNLQALIRDPHDERALRYFGIDSVIDSKEYLDGYLAAVAKRIKDPSIRDSPYLMTYLKRLINDPLDETALRFFKLLKETEPLDPCEAHIDSVKSYLSDQQAGTNLLSLLTAERDIHFGCPKDDLLIILVYQGQTYHFQKRPGVVLEIIERIMRIKPHSKFIRQADEVSGYSYKQLRKILRRAR